MCCSGVAVDTQFTGSKLSFGRKYRFHDNGTPHALSFRVHCGHWSRHFVGWQRSYCPGWRNIWRGKMMDKTFGVIHPNRWCWTCFGYGLFLLQEQITAALYQIVVPNNLHWVTNNLHWVTNQLINHQTSRWHTSYYFVCSLVQGRAKVASPASASQYWERDSYDEALGTAEILSCV